MLNTIEYLDKLGIWDLTLNHEIMTVEVGFNLHDYSNQINGVKVTRVYSLPTFGDITNVKISGQYVSIYIDDEVYQFKFEEGGNLIADIFEVNDEELEFKDTFACYSFLDD